MDIKGLWKLRVYLFGHLHYWYESSTTDLKTKKPFVSYLSIIWIMIHWIQSNNKILTITQITWITCFPYNSCFNQSCLYFSKSNVNGIPTQTQVRKIRNLWLRNQKYKQLVWMNGCSNQFLNGWVSWITKINLFGYQYLVSLRSTDHWSIFPNK